MKVNFSVIVATTGRPTLERALRSLELSKGDEVLVVGEDKPEIRGIAEKLSYRFIECPAGNDFGASERRVGIPEAKGTHLVFLDDDDIFLPGAFAAMRKACTDRPVMFQMIWNDGRTLWETKEIKCGNFGTPCFVTPNIPEKLGEWGLRYEGDYDFVVSTLALYPPDSLIWEPTVIYQCRPTPKVSIFTPTHKPDWLPNIYECLKEQTFTDWQWVIVYNNGAQPLNFNDPRVKEIHLEYPTNEWVGPMKSLACSKCDGDILLELDHDDLLTADALEEVVKAFEDPEIGFVYSNTLHSWRDPSTGEDFLKVQRFDERYGWRYREVEYKGHPLDEHIAFDPAPDCVSKIWFAPNHLRAFRRDVYESIGGYNTGMRILDDLDLMCRLYQVTRFHRIDKGLYVYRVHGDNTWLRYNDEIQNNVYRIHDQYVDALACRWADLNGLRKIELGGRMNAKPEYETVDLKDADIIADLNEKWPFEDSSVGVIRAIDVIEHLRDPLHTIKEIYRVLAPGGYAILQVPSTDGRGAFQDPTHVSFWNQNSFPYYTNADKARWIDTPVRFQSARLYTTDMDHEQVCWVVTHLVSLKDGYRPAGLIEI
jgi:glycosyltransferase involved in cell wall biosynthesis